MGLEVGVFGGVGVVDFVGTVAGEDDGLVDVMLRNAAGRPVRSMDVVFIVVLQWRARPAVSADVGIERFSIRLTTAAAGNLIGGWK